MQDFEKLGAFYLGKQVDPQTMQRGDGYLLYDSKDLTTHAVCVGMTGSGKTGLCIGVLEEAAIDGIPAIVIDPKGDMTNLMLTFPDLAPVDFAPWINREDAAAKGLSEADYAASQAETWRKGIAEWEQDGGRIRAMREKTEFALYTPGSTAGKPLSVLSLLASPPAAVLNDPESLNELAAGTASSLLGLLGIDADPIRSREHILISNLLLTAWRGGAAMDLPGLIAGILKPPFNRIGVMALDAFYPENDRRELSMQLNSLLASPGFQVWTQGEPLDISALLYTAEGKPKISILAISHLSDAERMFFVSLVLSKIVSWIRTQPGTSSLRALLYMDEIFGYFPPVANPPSKAPLLTLLKQARAYGLGVMLTTQNPMDLDYKGLANMGTWFIGRLQTDRDKNRLLDGLEGASAASGNVFDRSSMDKLLSGLGKRIFLMNNVHEDQPVLFETRWCLSYLRGPLMREEIRMLAGGGDATTQPGIGTVTGAAGAASAPAYTAGPASAAAAAAVSAAAVASVSSESTAPAVPEDIRQAYIPFRGDRAGIVYRAALMAFTEVHYADAKNGIAETVAETLFVPVRSGLVPVDWKDSESVTFSPEDLETAGAAGAAYLPEDPMCLKRASYTAWERDLSDHLFRNAALKVFRNDHLKKISKPGESDRDFRIRLDQESREERDSEIEKLRDTYAKKAAALEERVRKAEQAVQREKDQARDAGFQTAVSLGSTILGALLGSKKISATSLSRAATTVKGVGRSVRQQGDVNRSKETAETYKAQLEQLETEMQSEIDAITARLQARADDITATEIRPMKRDCLVKALALTWEPVRPNASGGYDRAW